MSLFVPGRRTARPIGAHLLLLIACVLLPTLGFAGAVIWRFAEAERARVEDRAQDAARGLAAALDRDLVDIRAVARVLAASESLASGDLAAFHERMVEAQRTLGAANIALRDATSRQILNSNVPWGAPLPTGTHLAQEDARAAKAGAPVFSDVFVGLTEQVPQFAVVVPLAASPKEGAPRFLSISMPVAREQRILDGEASLRPDIIASVVDQAGHYVVRSATSHNAVALPASKTPSRTGLTEVRDSEGEPTMVAYHWSEVADWRIAIRVPEAALYAPRRSALTSLALIGTAALALTLLAAFLVGRRLSAALSALSEAAAALGRDGRVPALATPLREVNAAGAALAAAARERTEAEASLRTSEARLRTLTESLEERVREEVRARDAAQEQLAQAQKMEMIGQLTGGIAHDFNNLLMAVLGNLELLQKRIAGDQRSALLVASARHAAERGAELTAQLLAFARKQHLQPTLTTANEVIAGMSNLMLHTLGGTVRVEQSLAPAPWPLRVDAGLMELAILNLVINARDATPDGGTLTIRTENVAAGDPKAPKTLPVGEYVMITVADTGIGMDEKVLAKAFDPFFTTKGIGKGSGLGLSMVLGTVQQHGGSVELTSQAGCGTTVRLYLPRAPMEILERPAAGETATSNVGRTRAGCVLVVDDDPEVRALMVECLRDLGHSAIAADSARAALDIVDRDPSIEVALVDLAMPEMSGSKFAAAARQRRPALRVVFMTGYADGSLLPDAPDAPVINKPFRAQELAARIAEALAGRDAEGPSNVVPIRRS